MPYCANCDKETDHFTAKCPKPVKASKAPAVKEVVRQGSKDSFEEQEIKMYSLLEDVADLKEENAVLRGKLQSSSLDCQVCEDRRKKARLRKAAYRKRTK